MKNFKIDEYDSFSEIIIMIIKFTMQNFRREFFQFFLIIQELLFLSYSFTCKIILNTLKKCFLSLRFFLVM
jgi:hypothetical protein